MQRICNTLASNGFDVLLVGRKMRSSKKLSNQSFRQKRLTVFFQTGFAFYAEYNLRLFFLLLFQKADVICAIDLDTILPVYFVSIIKGITRVYDAHELFTEQKEIVTRPRIQKIWLQIEKFSVPKFKNGYTVNQFIVDELNRRHKVSYGIIRNLPVKYATGNEIITKEKWIIYQGAVNEGRSFETLIPAMKDVDCKLIICGDGNFMQQAQQLVKDNQLENKVIFKGKVKPDELRSITQQAYIGVTLFDDTGLSNYYSLANRFFDYLHAGIPQLCVNYPVYKEINEKYGIAVLTDVTSAKKISSLLNNLLINEVEYKILQQNCMQARQKLNWQEEEKKLIQFYKRIFSAQR